MNNKSKGISMALIVAILWGISGNFAEYILIYLILHLECYFQV